MSFSETLGNAAKKLSGNGFANEIGLPTLLFDLATVSSNDKNWVSDAFNIAGDTFRSTVLAASYPIRKPVGFAFNKVLMPTAMLSYETGGRYLREPLSAAVTALATGDAKKSWENRDQISPGQAISYLTAKLTPGTESFRGDFDIFNAKDREIFQTDWAARTLSGSIDTFFTTVTDPLGKFAKGVGLARKALVTRPMGARDANAATLAKDFFMPRTLRNVQIMSPVALARTINEGREEGGEIYNTLSWMAKSDQTVIRQHPLVQASNDADTLSYLLGQSDTVDDVADVLTATALGDTEAMARLVAKRKELAFVFDKTKDVSKVDMMILDGVPTNGIVDDINVLDAASDYVANLDNNSYFQALNKLHVNGNALTKRTFGKPAFEKMAMNRAERRAAKVKGVDLNEPSKFPTVGYFQPTKYHPLVAVVNFGMKKVGDSFQETPSGYINLNDSDSYNELTAFGTLLRRIVGDEANPVVERHLNDYIQSGGVPELRARVVESFEDLSISLINQKLGISDEAGQVIWSQYKARRETARQMIKDRKFLMTGDDVILKIPYLERQGANALPMVDLANYSRVIEKNKGVLNTLNRASEITDPDSWRYTTGVLNDLWKASVLLRLGYTVRNLSEASLSILAKGYGLMALSDINREGFKGWYTNRVRDIERITDRRLVAQGLREDSVALRSEFADKQSLLIASERALQDFDVFLESIERLYRMGRLTDEQYKEAIDVFQYATGEYLYHGSPAPISALDNTRPMAMNFTEDMAERYATSAMPVISASEIYKRTSGRAYPMPRNIELSPGAEIGTPEVASRISIEEYNNFVAPYVQGVVGPEQAKLRGNLFAFSDDVTPEPLNSSQRKYVEGLKRVIQRSVIVQPTTVYRGVTRDIYANARVGDIIGDNAFISTSKEYDVASTFRGGNVLEIELPKGHPGLDIEATNTSLTPFGAQPSSGYIAAEKEVLLPPGTKFKVVEVKPYAGDSSIRRGTLDIKVQAILPKKPAKRQPSAALQTVAADMRDGFINSVNNGNEIQVLNPSTGRWTSIDPNTVSQELLTTGQFRIRKPGREGVTIGQKVYGKTVDLRSMQQYSGQARTRQVLDLADYPELQTILGVSKGTIRTRDAWQGKEPELLNWMRANGIGKLVLPDVKSRGGSTVLVDPDLVDGFGNRPTVALAEQRLNAAKNAQQLLSDEGRILQIIERTVQNQGGTFKFSDMVTGDVPTQGVAVAIRGATHAFPLEQARTNPENWVASVADHFEANFDKFGSADHFGTWIDDIDGVPHIKSDPVNVIANRAEAIRLGTTRNQQGVFDLGELEYIGTKGTGDVGASERFALGKGTKAVRPDESTRTPSVRRIAGSENFGKRVNEISESIASGRYPTEGIVSLVREIADGQAATRRDLQALLSRLNARVVEEERLAAPKVIQGTGRRTEKLYDGTTVEFDDAYRGEPGQILLDRTDNTESYRRFVDHPARMFAAEHGNYVENVLSPNMPDYYSGYANQLNTFFRSPDGRIDPLIEQMLNDTRPEEIVAWLRAPENAAYARKFNIDVPGNRVASERLNVSIDAEDFVGDLYSAYNRYLPDSQTQEAFRNGEITESWLRNHFADNTEMPDIIGRIVPTSPQARNWQDGLAKVIDRAFYFLGSLPETTFARHPLARQVYRSEMKQRLDVALATKRMNIGDDAQLTTDDINKVRREAVESTRKEVNKTLFTIIRKSYAGEKMRLVMPFFNAWENTIRRWSGLATENPAVIARAGQIVSTLRNQPNVVDRDGNPTTEFSYENKIVLPMPSSFIKGVEKIPGYGKGMAEALRSSGTQVSIPVRSLDIIMQGEILAGFGPLVIIPVNEIVKLKPDLEDIVTKSMLPILPFGPQEGTIRNLFPPAMQKLASLGGQDEAWSRTFNTVYRYELIRFNLGERDTMPELSEVKNLADSLYRVKILSNLVMPFAAQYDSPLSFYTQQFRRIQQVYGADAETLFLQMYPEMGPALVSSSYNPTGAQASQAAFQNIKRYKGLISKIGQTTPEMIGFLVNDPDGKYDFSEAVYAWQYRNTPVPGSIEKYRERRNPAELKKDANIKVGWVEFRKKMTGLDYQLDAQGYESYQESGAEELLALKQMMIADLTRRNQDWAADYYNVDRGKWIYRMQSIKTMLTDPQWMQENGRRQVTRDLAVYLNTRTQIARELSNRRAYGGASTLTAKDNADLDAYWNSTVAQLKKSPEFNDFYNRFLQNDPVTLG